MSKKTERPDDAATTAATSSDAGKDASATHDASAGQAPSALPDAPAAHPFPVHDDDLVAVEVLAEEGVKVAGNVYRKTQTLTVMRGQAARANQHNDGQVFRILQTVRYANDPNPDASYEQQTVPGPLDIS